MGQRLTQSYKITVITKIVKNAKIRNLSAH